MKTILLPTLTIAFAAFCVWLTVRIVNRGWRHGRRFWIIMPFALLLVYPLSFGPACWIISRINEDNPHLVFQSVYLPLGWSAKKLGPPAWSLLVNYAELGMPKVGTVTVYTGREAYEWIGRVFAYRDAPARPSPSESFRRVSRRHRVK